MDGQEMELTLTLFFLVALVLISRFREQFMQEDRQGYRHISASVVILSITALVKLAAANSAFTNIVFLSDSGSVQLLVLIGSVTGIALLTAGISSWLPIARVQRQIGKERIERLDVVRKVAQLVRIESRLPQLLQGSLRYTAEGCGFERGELYCCLPYQETIRFLEAYTGSTDRDIPEGTIQFSKRLFQHHHTTFDYKELIDSYPENMPKATIVQPVLSHGRLVALMLFWVTKGEKPNTEVRSIVNTIANLLGRQVRNAALELQVDLFARSNTMTGDLISMHTVEKGYRSFVSKLTMLFRSYLSFDHISLTRLTPTGEVRRYSVGLNGAFLEELNLEASEVVSAVTDLVAHDGVMFSGMNAYGESDYDLSKMKSQMVGLVSSGENEATIIRFGSARVGCYRPRHRYLLQTALPILDQKVKQLTKQETALAYTDRVQSIKKLVEHLSTAMRFEDFACKAAESVLAATDSDMVRVSLADNRLTFLTSCAMRLSRSIKPQTPALGHMILALMPAHLRAISEEQLIDLKQIDSIDPQEDAEWSQVMAPSIDSALIMPFGGSHTRKGTITIGGARGWRSDTDTNHFVQLISNLLTLSLINSTPVMESTIAPDGEVSSAETPDSVTYRQAQVRTALTGLMGSIELLEREPATEKNLENCLRIMRASVSKLISLTSGSISESTPIRIKSERTVLPVGTMESI